MEINILASHFSFLVKHYVDVTSGVCFLTSGEQGFQTVSAALQVFIIMLFRRIFDCYEIVVASRDLDIALISLLLAVCFKAAGTPHFAPPIFHLNWHVHRAQRTAGRKNTSKKLRKHLHQSDMLAANTQNNQLENCCNKSQHKQTDKCTIWMFHGDTEK